MYFPHDTMTHTGFQENLHFGNLANMYNLSHTVATSLHRTRQW